MSDSNSSTTASSIRFGSPWLSDEIKKELDAVATALCSPGKGLSACDESPGTIGKRFDAVGIENTAENRRHYRQMLFETSEIDNYLSGVILDPETLTQTSNTDNKPFPQVLKERGIVPGVKPHLKVYKLPGTNGDTVMQGLDSLAERLKLYKQQGAQFAKWRSPLTIDLTANRPTDLAIQSNMNDLARYALICQSVGIMPIVEPDVSLSGSHTLEDAVRINIKIQSTLFHAMLQHGVYMSGATLKANMVNPGKDCASHYSVQDIAQANLHVLRQSFPVAMKGNHYLSGGQTLDQATARLNAINQHKAPSDPWSLSFSWSAAIQLPLLDLCKGSGGKLQLDAMSELYRKELQMAHLAACGKLNEDSTAPGDHKPAV